MSRVALRPSIQRPAGLRDIVRGDPSIVLSAVLFVAGVVAITFGWNGVTGTRVLTERIPYLISGVLPGLGLLIVAGALAASFGAGRETIELRQEVARMLEAVGEARASGTPIAEAPSERALADGRVFLVPGGRSFHVARCPIVGAAGAGAAVPRAQATSSGFSPCKLCRPDRS